MTWLAPLGFLGLLGVVALIVIYVIKPNFQQKMISTTYVWHLSLKYRKKRIPISRLNNLLIFLCQFLILTICGLLLAYPVIAQEKVGDESERVVIIDASANMRLNAVGETRFERAVGEARLFVEDVLDEGSIVSVILADETPEFIVQRAGADMREDTLEAIDALLADGGRCSYRSANLDAAVELAEEVLRYNAQAQLYLYTATDYLEKNGIHVVDVSHPEDWNAAILDCRAEYDENSHYEISIDVGCFGRTNLLTVYCEVHGANDGKLGTVTLSRTEFFDPAEETKTVTFTSDDMGATPLTSFDYLEVYVSVDDCFVDDNSLFLYGGKKPTIRIQYASSLPNNYFSGMVRTIRQMMKDKWYIDFKQVKADEKAATEGYDFYIFEHTMPSVMPTDGVVLLVDPYGEPEGAGIRFGNTFGVDWESPLANGTPHELTKYVDFGRLTIAKYTEIYTHDGYEELAYYQGKPVVLAKNNGDAKIVVWAFDLNYSSLPAMPDFTFLMYNMFNYFIPSTIDSYTYEIGDIVDLAARGTELKVTGGGKEHSFPGSTGQIPVERPGTYTVTQKPMQGDHLIVDNFFVKVPNFESHITKTVDALPISDVDVEQRIEFEDLIFYFAIGLVAFLFAEWALYNRKNY